MPDFINAFIKGIIIALVFGVPAGAIGTLTIQRTLKSGFVHGLVTGLGSSAADLIYACIAVLGITAVSDWLNRYEIPIRLIGSALILAYGIAIILGRNKNRQANSDDNNGGLFTHFISAFMIAIFNPATILSFTVAFSTFDVMRYAKMPIGIFLLLGLFLGTLVWWLALTVLVNAFRKKISDRIYSVLNLCLGILLIIFSAVVVVNVIVENIL